MASFPVPWTSLPAGATPGSHVIDQTNYEAIRTALRADSGDRNGGLYNYASIGDLYFRRIFAVDGGQVLALADGHNFVTEAQGAAAAHGQYAVSAPGGELAAGANTITVAPVPPGVNGTDTEHRIRISGGAGAAETVLITGGDAVAGAASGRLTFVCDHGHTGAWTVGSATGGIAEAQQDVASGSGAGEVYIGSQVTAYATVTAIAGTVITFRGPNKYAWMIVRAADFGSGAVFLNNKFDAYWVIRDMTIYQGAGTDYATAVGIDISSGYATILDTVIFNGFIGIRDTGASWFHVRGVQCHLNDQTFKAEAGLEITNGVSNAVISDSSFGGSPDGANVVSYGILITAADGVWMCNVSANGDWGIGLIATAPAYIANVVALGLAVDGFRSYGAVLTGTGGFGEIRFIGPHIHGQAGNGWTAMGPAVYINPAGAASAIEWNGGTIAGSAGVGLTIGALAGAGAGTNVKVTAVTVFGNNVSNTAGIPGVYLTDGAKGVDLIGITCHNGTTGHQKYSLQTGGALSDSVIAYNNFGSVAAGSVETAPVSIGGAMTRVVFGPNGGITDAIPIVASGASVDLPANPTIKIIGTTPIMTLNGGWEGRGVKLIFTDAAPGGVGTGGNIARTQAAAQNQALSLSYDGSNWY